MIEPSDSSTPATLDPQILVREIVLEALTRSQGELSSSLDVSLRDLSVSSSTDDLSSGDIFSSRPLSAPRPRATEPEAPVADPLSGMIVADRYRIVEPIGRGGMGIVYKVQHTRIGKLMAMKVLTGELSQSSEVVRRFKREGLMVSKLQSPNTVQVFDFGASFGLTYLVMELLDGENLGRVLRAEGPMPFSRLGKIIIQVCNSLAEAHDKGIVHRDIKPENIMILRGEGGADVAKVLDFGLAKLRETEALNDVTCQGAIMGTPHYMAPEQIRGEEVDSRTDIYSVGALIYRLLTGAHPFSAPSPMALLEKHLHELPVSPIERAPELEIPPGVSRLVMRALQKAPEDRFQHIEELRARLVEELRAAGSVSVDNLLDPEKIEREVRHRSALATRDEVDAYERKLRRNRYGAVSVAAAVVVAGAGAGASLLVPVASRFSGVESEPNNTAAEATALPLGRAMTGTLGKRLDSSHGDRDFYALDLPASAPGESGYLSLRVSALPNLPMCTMLYKPGFADAIGQYCVGRPGRDLVIPALALEPGRYFLAVVQDLGAHGGVAPYVYESISDAYTVVAESTLPVAGAEIEPNDQIASATPVRLGEPCAAAIGWARDEDVFCAVAVTSGRIRWTVSAGLHDGGVLEVTPLRQGEEGPVGRIPEGAKNPWQSAPIAASPASPPCLRVRLGGALGGGSEPYRVEASAAP